MLARTVILLGLLFIANAISIPKYLKPCSRSHNFTECATKSAQYAIPFLIKGDRHLKIAPMNPVRVEFVELSSNNINLKMRNIEVYGLDTVKIVNVTVDFENQSARIISSIAKSTILGDYEINGQIILPITGHGPVNITLYNGLYQYDTKWDFFTKNGIRYMNITDSKYDYVVDKITYDFKNLFNGDKVWGEQMNKILNENWKEVNEDLKAPFLKTLLVYHNDISTKIFSQIPFDQLFLE